MLALDSPLKSLEVVLAGAVTTNQLPWTITYDDLIQSTMALSEVIEADGTTNDSTAVSMSSTPALVAGIRRTLKFLSIPNTDTVQATVTVRVNNNGTFRTVKKAILAVNDILEFTAARGFYVSDSVGNLKVSLGFGDPVTVTHGGTGLATLTANAVLIGAGTAAVAFTAVGATNTLLHGNTGAAPTYSAVVNADIANATIDLTAKVTGTLPATNGGTGQAVYAVGDVLSASTTTALSRVAAVATGQLLASNGVNMLPQWSDTPTLATRLTVPTLIGGTGVTSTLVLRSTSGIGATGADVVFQTGTNGNFEGMRVLNGNQGIVINNPSAGAVAVAGIIRLANSSGVHIRNLANTQDIIVFGSNELVDGNSIEMGSQVVGAFTGFKWFIDSLTPRVILTNTDLSTTGTMSIGSTVAKYKNISTVSNGVPAEYATIDTTGLVANVAASTLYAVPATGAGMYRVSAYVVETTAGSISSTLPNVQVVYTDADTLGSITIDVTPVLGVAGIGQTGALTANTIGTASTGEIPISVKASTTIQYQTVNYASNLAGMAYSLHMKLEAL